MDGKTFRTQARVPTLMREVDGVLLFWDEHSGGAALRFEIISHNRTQLKWVHYDKLRIKLVSMYSMPYR